MADENVNNGQEGGNGQTRSVMPTSTTNVTTRRLGQAMQALWSKTDAAKADKVSQATSGNFASLDGNGNLTDSGHKHSDYASSTQGGKADTAVQSVKIGSSSGTELNNNTNVVIPLAVAQGTAGATDGLISSQDQKKLDEIAAGAQVNQVAFSNVKVGSTTIQATSSDPSAAGSTINLVAGTYVSLTPNSADKSVTINSTLESKTAASGGTDVSLVTTGEKDTWNNPQNSIAWDGTYNASTNKGATVSTVTNAINALDVNAVTVGASKTLSSISETNGKISATAVDIQIAESQVTNLVSDLALKAPLDSPALTGTPTAPTAATGTNTTQIATTAFVNAEIASKMEEADAMIYKGPIAGTSAETYGTLTPAADKGWTYKVSADGIIDGVPVYVGDMLICNTDNTPAATSSTYSTVWNNWDYYPGNMTGAVIGPSTSTTNAVAGYADNTGKVIKVLTASEVKAAAGLSNVVNTGDSDTPTQGGTTKFTTGGAYTELAKKADKSTAVTNVAWDSTNKKLTKTINGTTTDVVTAATLKTALDLSDKEDKSNKVTSWSSTTTDDHYPSEKLVKDSLDNKVDKVSGKGLSTNDYTTAEKNKLAGIATGAEVNQNAFSNVKVGNSTIAAGSATDTVEFIGGGATTVSANTTDKSVTISSTDEKVKATAKTDNVAYPLLAASSASPTSGNATNAIYDTGVTLNPSTNTISANISGNAATASAAESGSALETAINGKASSTHTHKVKINGTIKTITAPGTADANVTDLGTYLTSSDVANKADKVSNATSGNFAALDANGNLTDSGKKAGDFKTVQTAVTDPTASGTTITAIDTIEQDTNGVITATKKTIRGATTSQTGVVQLAGSIGATVSSENNKAASEKAVRDAINALDSNKTSTDGTNVQVKVTLADGKVSAVNITTDNTENKSNKVTAWSATTTDTHYPSEKLVKTSLDNKADRVSNATSGNFAGLDSNGNLTDSGSKASDFATSAQGGKADTAIQGVKLNGASSALTPDSNKVVTIPDAIATGATGATNGLMTAADKAKLNGIATGAEVNQNAFSNVKVGSTTVAADTKTDTLELVAAGAVTITPDASNDKITISSTDQSVTAVGNHYAPTEDAGAEKDASGGTATQLPTSSSGTLVQVVTGVKMDAKGHVTGVVSKGLWSPDNNTTYTDVKLGFGNATATSSSSGVYTVTLSDYDITAGNGGIVGIKFTSDVPANSTLNINSKGAKNIKYRGSNITAGIIQNGDTAYFQYDGTSYILFATDRSVGETTEQEIQDIIDSLT